MQPPFGNTLASQCCSVWLRRPCWAILVLACSTTFARAEPAAVSFRNDVMAVISKAGCNAGTCHGNKNGKGGFKLSLRGQDPEAAIIATEPSCETCARAPPLGGPRRHSEQPSARSASCNPPPGALRGATLTATP